MHNLINYLAAAPQAGPHLWDGWLIRPLEGGANNRLYRASRGGDDLVVKFTIKDGRDRAGREFAALSGIAAVGLPIAPEPVLLERDRCAQPVVVQRYLAGEPLAAPPESDDEWLALVAHYATIHTITPDSIPLELPSAIVNMADAEAGLRLIGDQVALVPPEVRPPGLDATVERLARLSLPRWQSPPLVLCRVDANSSNFLRRNGPWASVDWENSGWGDGVFELADLWTHPAYAGVPVERRDWAVATYCTLIGDHKAAERARCYILLMLVWWMGRTARLLYEVPLGRDERLVVRPPDWAERARAQYAAYRTQAEALLAHW